MKKCTYIFASALLMTTLLTGCSNSKNNYDYYEKEVKNLYEDVMTTDAVINKIDTGSETYKEEFFDTLDKLEESLSDFSKVDTPNEYKECTTFANQALGYLNEAETLFHNALDNEYDENSFNMAVNKYNQAVKLINVIGMTLQGKEVIVSE